MLGEAGTARDCARSLHLVRSVAPVVWDTEPSILGRRALDMLLHALVAIFVVLSG